MPKIPKPPFVMVIAGLDPSGGAGIVADVLTLKEFDCHPSVIAATITSQTISRYFCEFAVSQDFIMQQIATILSSTEHKAVKIGLLAAPPMALAVSEALGEFKLPVVIDPIFKSTSGKQLASDELVEAMKTRLFPLATTVTPNRSEISRLTGIDANDKIGAIEAGLNLCKETGCKSAVITGVLTKTKAMDILVRKSREPVIFTRKRLVLKKVRGTGCRFSSAIAARLAWGDDIETATRKAGDWLHQKLEKSLTPSAKGFSLIR
ncbi:MAG: bifunctional hydroxymethylpyrimidine kinase/phosphomethylpyrimidine kinase [Myxococcota bacterium]